MSEPGLHRILAFDCSGGACSAAVWCHGALGGERFLAMDRGHAEALLPQIRAVLTEAGLAATDLDALVTTVGPGSFTGLRIGLAAAKGLALATDLPIMAFTGFEAMLAGVTETRRAGRSIAVAIDSRRGPVFAQLFDTERVPVGSAMTVEPADFDAWLPAGPVLVLGDGSPALVPLSRRSDVEIVAEPGRVRAGILAGHAASLGPAGLGRLPIAPLYLRAPDVTLPRRVPAS
jgi:tRNA threonylcarbamoyladenosine biosynthesis protein TsaB